MTEEYQTSTNVTRLAMEMLLAGTVLEDLLALLLIAILFVGMDMSLDLKLVMTRIQLQGMDVMLYAKKNSMLLARLLLQQELVQIAEMKLRIAPRDVMTVTLSILTAALQLAW